MARRKSSSSTAALERASPPAGADDGPSNMSIDIRKISNGYISVHSRMKDGEYFSKEEYHRSKPTIEELVGAGEATGTEKPERTNHLKGAVSLLSKGKV